MPPLPSTTHALTSRLTALSDQNKAIQQLIQRLAKLDFQPGSQPLHSEEGDIRLELSAEIHESLKGVEEDLELAKQEVEDFVGTGARDSIANSAFGVRRSDSRKDSERETEKQSERSRLAVLLARLTEDLKSTRSQFRKAQLTAKHNADRAKLKERELLFSNLQSGSSTPSSTHRRRNNPQLSESEIVAQASTDVTGALRRTHQLMQEELSRSRFAQETLEQSTAALADLGEKYSDLNTLLANSRALVSTLLKSQKSDTWYLETTFYILITTVIWLVFRRWLYGPISWFLLWPLKLVFRLLFAVVPIGASSAVSSSLAASSSQPSTSLVVQPSASGDIPSRPTAQDNQNYVRVGGGGRGHAQQDPSTPQSLSQSVGQMAEQNQQEQQQKVGQEAQQAEQKEQVVRGDGTVLPDRGAEQPPNPKKKMFEGEEKPKFVPREDLEKRKLHKRDEL
ncbi:Sec20-domain-containing protein [Massarina eburnea CBS 473.64]|uniref:Sec20-domain-containing protein n=1 Tax=Massarina eburnea CBS 473.64 TaxID=1395130 RepID=A0A6A6RG36_9PLEO|nr:Sec20-domain-containing protein [Massarina eburnea CBS 473.64]